MNNISNFLIGKWHYDYDVMTMVALYEDSFI